MAIRPEKSELIDELNDTLDSLSLAEAIQIFSKLSISDLLKLKLAIDQAIDDAIKDKNIPSDDG